MESALTTSHRASPSPQTVQLEHDRDKRWLGPRSPCGTRVHWHSDNAEGVDSTATSLTIICTVVRAMPSRG